jgi:hypothetical protein
MNAAVFVVCDDAIAAMPPTLLGTRTKNRNGALRGGALSTYLQLYHLR